MHLRVADSDGRLASQRTQEFDFLCAKTPVPSRIKGNHPQNLLLNQHGYTEVRVDVVLAIKCRVFRLRIVSRALDQNQRFAPKHLSGKITFKVRPRGFSPPFGVVKIAAGHRT